MKDGYNLNVALNGRHYCNIELGNVHPDDVKEKARFLASLFPADRGFKCDLTKWECRGHGIQL